MPRVKRKDTYSPTPTDLVNGERVVDLMPHSLRWHHLKTGVSAYLPTDLLDATGVDKALLDASAKRQSAYHVFIIPVRRPSGVLAGLLLSARQSTLPLPKYLQEAEANGLTLDEESVTF